MERALPNNVSLFVVASLGAVFAAFYASEVLPDNAFGRSGAIAIFWIALYPVARATWFADLPRWRWWASLATITIGTLILSVWRRTLPASVDAGFAVMAFGIALFATLAWLWRARRQVLPKPRS